MGAPAHAAPPAADVERCRISLATLALRPFHVRGTRTFFIVLIPPRGCGLP
jgi:hypothetical protein